MLSNVHKKLAYISLYFDKVVNARPSAQCDDVSVIANALPKKFSEMIHHALKGDFVSAQKILGHFLAIDPFLYEEGNPVGVKLILENLGLMQAQVIGAQGCAPSAVLMPVHCDR